MNKDPKYVTFIFSNVPDTNKFVEVFKRHVPFPIVAEKEQNDGVVALVVEGVSHGDIEGFMNTFIARFGFTDVYTHATIGNIFGK